MIVINKNIKTITFDYLYNFFYQILLLIVPLITTPYITRVFGTDSLGEYTYSFTIANYFGIFALLGINNYGNRSIAQRRDDTQEISNTFSQIYSIQLIASFVCLIIYAMLYIVVAPKVDIVFYVINGFYIFSAVFDVNWLLFGLEKFKLTVARNLVVKIVLTVAIFIFVKTPDDIYIYAILIVMSYIVTNVCVLPYVFKITKFKLPLLDDIKKHIKPIFILFVPVIAVSIYKFMDKLMLGNMVNMSEVTIYEYSQRMTNIPAGVYGALGTVMLPKISNLIAQKDEKTANKYTVVSLMIVGFIMPAMALGLASIAPEFSLIFYGDAYEKCGIVIQTMVPMLIFISANNVIRTQVLLPYERDNVYIVALGLGAISNLVLNFILIPIYGAVGASIATVAAEATVFTYQVIKSRDLIDYKKYFIVTAIAVAHGMIMFLILRAMDLNINMIWMLIIRVAIGIVWYCIPTLFIFLFLKRRKNG